MMLPVDMKRMDGCILRDERGVALAVLNVDHGTITVKKTTACSLGTYFHIIDRLQELGYDAK